MLHTRFAHRLNTPLAFDLVERMAVVILYGFFTFNVLQRFQETGSVVNFLILCSEGSVVLFVLLRRLTTDISLKPMDWLVAVLGTTMPLLVVPTGQSTAVPGLAFLCAVLMLVGLGVQIAAKLTLRRSFGIVAANRGIKVGGPYRIVRHPMYAGYLMTHIGFLLYNPSLWNLSVYAIGFGCQVARILAEERILSQDTAYREFAAKTRYRLLVGVF
ncbi:MAG TPA: methyltransferase [Microvirga sp.]|nr:methyltransferase [Microvirga sp.]